MRLNGNDLYMVRGDDEIITVSIKRRQKDGTYKQYMLSSSDTVRLYIGYASWKRTSAVTRVKTVSDVVYDKTYGTASVHIKPSDTSSLAYGAGQYVYSICITFSDGEVKHIFPAAAFVLEREV